MKRSLPTKLIILVDDVWRAASAVSTFTDDDGIVQAELNGMVLPIQYWLNIDEGTPDNIIHEMIIQTNINSLIDEAQRKKAMEKMFTQVKRAQPQEITVIQNNPIVQGDENDISFFDGLEYPIE